MKWPTAIRLAIASVDHLLNAKRKDAAHKTHDTADKREVSSHREDLAVVSGGVGVVGDVGVVVLFLLVLVMILVMLVLVIVLLLV